MSLIPWIFYFLAGVYIKTDIETTSLSDHFAQDTIFLKCEKFQQLKSTFRYKNVKVCTSAVQLRKLNDDLNPTCKLSKLDFHFGQKYF